jgi:hypothetical protein
MNRSATLIAPLVLGTMCECLIWSWSQGEAETWNEGVRLAARYSGRLSFVHLGFLALNIAENEVELVPVKLIGGALAYAMVLLHPLLVFRLTPQAFYHRVHYGYVGFVMAVTFLARINGDFEGAEPSWFHGAGIVILGLLLLRWLRRWWSSIQKA